MRHNIGHSNVNIVNYYSKICLLLIFRRINRRSTNKWTIYVHGLSKYSDIDLVLSLDSYQNYCLEEQCSLIKTKVWPTFAELV